MSEFRIAFCIICHKYTPVLQELIDRLSVPGNGIFVHVDRKARMKDFAALSGKVRFVTPRIDIRWGDYGQICCMRRLYEATRSGDYRYIVLLSGDTLPLYDMTYIREFLAASYARNTEFVAMQSHLNLEEFYGKVRTAHYVPVLRWGGKRSLREKLKIKYAKHFRPARTRSSERSRPWKKGATGSRSPTACATTRSNTPGHIPITTGSSATRRAATKSISTQSWAVRRWPGTTPASR
ncbi:beta-1,6-N-acetylglucosaminyltransferase [Alistipes sp. D31t1_170403_E11]|uniref:beta-1,6-N-acetylglucosaminyltransferase n=1 Tax=Alistipes sp. D31t1_170403_E11 TaxID=2787128 RepID=UPI00189933AF|nr:beta-1,6-N-acetylglucosaminyltransferase [Alistipes sp. D31t1_170403_E11]